MQNYYYILGALATLVIGYFLYRRFGLPFGSGAKSDIEQFTNEQKACIMKFDEALSTIFNDDLDLMKSTVQEHANKFVKQLFESDNFTKNATVPAALMYLQKKGIVDCVNKRLL